MINWFFDNSDVYEEHREPDSGQSGFVNKNNTLKTRPVPVYHGRNPHSDWQLNLWKTAGATSVFSSCVPIKQTRAICDPIDSELRQTHRKNRGMRYKMLGNPNLANVTLKNPKRTPVLNFLKYTHKFSFPKLHFFQSLKTQLDPWMVQLLARNLMTTTLGYDL